MRKLTCILTLIIASTLLLLAAKQTNRSKYRHVRTNKRAWVQHGISTGFDDGLEGIPEIYVSDDSLLIVAEPYYYGGIDVIVSDYHNNDAEVLSQHFEGVFFEVRISIKTLPEGVYTVTIRQDFGEGMLYGFFAKGEQYIDEAETLGIPVTNVPDKSRSVYDLAGRKATVNGKGPYIVNGKKVLHPKSNGVK